MIKVQVAAALSVYYIILILQFTKQFKCFISGTVVNSLLGHDTHAVTEAGLGEAANIGPLVLIGIIV